MSDSQSSDEECMMGSASESSGNSSRGNEAPRSVATAGMSDEQLARMLTRKRIRWGSRFRWHSTHARLMTCRAHSNILPQCCQCLTVTHCHMLSGEQGKGRHWVTHGRGRPIP